MLVEKPTSIYKYLESSISYFQSHIPDPISHITLFHSWFNFIGIDCTSTPDLPENRFEMMDIRDSKIGTLEKPRFSLQQILKEIVEG